MTDHKETDSKKDLNDDEIELWEAMTRDVKPLKGRDSLRISQSSRSSKKEDLKKQTIDDSQPKHVQSNPSKPKSRDIDRNTMRALRRGEITIEGRLDLHGMNQSEARQSLIRFIISAEASGKRCVLVVTGKGNTGRRSENWLDQKPGVLKRKVPDWLYETELNSIVLQAVPAQPKDGGDGALYVYLRRRRDYTNSPAPNV